MDNPDSPGGSLLTVVSYNIRSCLEQGLDAVADVLKTLEPDVVALQEVDRDTIRSDGADQAEQLAAALGLPHWHFFPATPWVGGGEYGIALLSRFPLEETRLLPLPVDGPNSPESNTEPRVLASAVIRTRGNTLRIFNTHFGLSDSQRRKQAETVARALQSEQPTILLGDFNATPDDPVLGPVRGALTDAHADLPLSARVSFPQPPPGKAIDYVFHSLALVVEHAAVIGDAPPASDHHPLLVRFRLPG